MEIDPVEERPRDLGVVEAPLALRAVGRFARAVSKATRLITLPFSLAFFAVDSFIKEASPNIFRPHYPLIIMFDTVSTSL